MLGETVQVTGQGAGLHLVLELRQPLSDEVAFVARAQEQGCRILPFSDFFVAAPQGKSRLLLGFGGITTEEIGPGVACLARLLEEQDE
ncbi:MAG: hypothetical protein C0621_04735 [Desulfuromonas sp.]|nr:MAG: hypothetical protein C0621_04735 [Desulfuromonas sp.]